jgi:hypothetical protein
MVQEVETGFCRKRKKQTMIILRRISTNWFKNQLCPTIRLYRDGGHEQLISNAGRFKPAFAERDKKQTMIDLRGISTEGFLDCKR